MHAHAYALALEKITGVDINKMLPTPNIDLSKRSIGDFKQQNLGGTTTADLVEEDDPQKAQKLTDPDDDRDGDEAEE